MSDMQRLSIIVASCDGARFYAALDEVVAPVAADVRFVDMRYTNGFSIGWKRPRV